MYTKHTGNIWEAHKKGEIELLLFTANSIVTSTNSLVMGAGFAKEVRDRFPTLPAEFAEIMAKQGVKSGGEYNLIISEKLPIGAFQVKLDWRQKAYMGLIKRSAAVLKFYAHLTRVQIHMNYPGIGKGMLEMDAVEPLLRMLPENVHIWTKG